MKIKTVFSLYAIHGSRFIQNFLSRLQYNDSPEYTMLQEKRRRKRYSPWNLNEEHRRGRRIVGNGVVRIEQDQCANLTTVAVDIEIKLS